MLKEKIELWKISNHVVGYGILSEPFHDIQETICKFCNENNVRYCFHKITYEEPRYEDGRYIKSGPWSGGGNFTYKESHSYYSGCELQPEKIKKPWKFGDYIKYVTIYFEENDNAQ